MVPVRDREQQLACCLRAIRRSAGVIDHEVVVVDDDSRDASRSVAIASGARVVVAGGQPLGELRNLGARAANGDVLAFVDSDVLLTDGWAAAALDALACEGAAVAGAPCTAPADGNWIQRTYDLLRGRAAQRRSVRWLPAGALAVRRDAFGQIGGFDAGLSSCEDVDLCRRLRARGRRIVYDPALASVHCDDPRTLRAVFSAEVKRGAANSRVSVRRHAGGEIPSLLVSIAVLALLLLLAPALAASLRGERLPLYAVTTVLLVLVGMRASRMARVGGWRRLPAALVVGSVYELGRAVGLVAGSAAARRPRRGAR